MNQNIRQKDIIILLTYAGNNGCQLCYITLQQEQRIARYWNLELTYAYTLTSWSSC
jgi:hypothetical protein